MANKITCTCGHSWNKSSSSKKDATICHICGKNVMKNGGWLDRYDDGGSMQEHQENYNDSDTYASPDMLGDGFSNVGRNYSPAWGGQFQSGGYMQKAKSFPVIDDIEKIGKDGQKVPDWAAMAKQAKKIGAKQVRTKSGATIVFDNNWQATGATDPDPELATLQLGGFLQPTSSKLPEGYVIPYNTPSTELSMSIGGEEGEPAYLIPSFKYGKLLKDPIAEYRKTGEHLGGPFKTWQEAEKFGEMRHKYVEKGQDIPTPLKTWGDMQMGGSLPGSVGFTYARTKDIPSNGPYAKKTKASAQNGGEMQFYQNGLDWNPKTISRDGSKIKKDDNGYWNPENWGKPVEIGSNNITMQGMHQPLIGISDEGDVQYMQPGEDYKFKGKKVVEYPIAKEGDVIPPKTKTEYLKEKLAAQQEALQIAQDAQSMKKKDWEAKYKSVLSNDAKIKSFSGISSYDDFKNNIPTFNSRIKNYNKDLKNFEEQVAQEQSLIDQSQEPSSYIKNYLNQYNTLEDIRKAASTKYGYNPSQQLDPLQFVSNNMVKEANERISTNKGFPLYQDPTNEMTCINGVCSIAADQGVDFSNFPHGEGTGVRQDAQGRWIPQYNPTFSQNYEKAGYRILDANEAPQPGDVSQYYEGKRPHHAEIVLSRDDNKINTFNNYQLTNYGKGLSTREFDPNQDGRYDVKDQSDTKYYRLTPEAAEKAAMKNPEYSKLVEGKKKFESSDENKQYQESTKFIQNKNASLLGEDAPLFDEIVSGARGKYAKDKPGLISSLSAKSKNPKLLEKIIDQSYKNGGWLEKYN